MRLLRNLARRKLRTTLTIMGITIGIWALVVFSSMANKINALVEGGSQYYADKVVVSDASNIGMGLSIVPMKLEIADEIRAMGGVAAVDPQIQMLVDDFNGGFGMPNMILGGVPGADNGLERFTLETAQGRLLTAGDEGSRVAVLGSDLARQFDVGSGETLALRGVDFEVVGVLQPTLTAPDNTVFVPLAAAQELFVETLPPAVRDVLAAEFLASQMIVYPTGGTDPNALAEQVEASIANVTTLTGDSFDEQVGASTAIFNAIIIGVAVISLVVGGLSVINTMAMSVAERTREIGIKRAIGGSRGRIIRELVSEAGLIGMIGGLIGLGLGAVVVVLANEAGRASGTVLFDLTLGTAIFAVAFSTVLGMLAGIVPAWSAARLDPVAALRYE
jgi:putative ABC transport system permease protein